MATQSTRRDLKALHRLVKQADLALETIPDPHPSIASARESLNAAIAISKLLASTATDDALKLNAAAALGSKGGSKTAERGPEYYARIAAMRTNRKGGRPKLPPQASAEYGK